MGDVVVPTREVTTVGEVAVVGTTSTKMASYLGIASFEPVDGSRVVGDLVAII